MKTGWENWGFISLNTRLQVQKLACSTAIRVILLVGVLLYSSFPAASQSPSFDCSRASNRVETAICNDPQLARRDTELAAAFSSALSKAESAETLRSQQREWLRRRNACASSQCILDAFDTRLAQLRQIVPEEQAQRRPSLGVNVQDLSSEVAKAYGLPMGGGGAFVRDVAPSGAAAAAGLMRGDVVQRFNGQSVPDARTLATLIQNTTVGAAAELLVRRQSGSIILSVTIGAAEQRQIAAKNPEPSAAVAVPEASRPRQTDATKATDTQASSAPPTRRVPDPPTPPQVQLFAEKPTQTSEKVVKSNLRGEIYCSASGQSFRQYVEMDIEIYQGALKGKLKFTETDMNMVRRGSISISGSSIRMGVGPAGEFRLTAFEDPDPEPNTRDSRWPSQLGDNLRDFLIQGTLLSDAELFSGTIFATTTENGISCQRAQLSVRGNQSPGLWKSKLERHRILLGQVTKNLPDLKLVADDDWVIYHERPGKAPNARLKLDGTTVFENDRINVCFGDLQNTTERRNWVLAQVAAHAKVDISAVRVACDSRDLLALRPFEVAALSFGSLELLGSDPPMSLFGTLSEKNYRQAELDAQAEQMRLTRERSLVQDARREFRAKLQLEIDDASLAGSASDVLFFVSTGRASSETCFVGLNDGEMERRRLIVVGLQKNAVARDAEPEVSSLGPPRGAVTPDEVFARIQRGGCSHVMGNRAEMREIIPAVKKLGGGEVKLFALRLDANTAASFVDLVKREEAATRALQSEREAEMRRQHIIQERMRQNDLAQREKNGDVDVSLSCKLGALEIPLLHCIRDGGSISLMSEGRRTVYNLLDIQVAMSLDKALSGNWAISVRAGAHPQAVLVLRVMDPGGRENRREELGAFGSVNIRR